jgi:hypothetical protein
MGHRDDVWASPIFQDILTGGILWSLGDAQADVTPNIGKATEGAWTNPPFPEPAPEAAGKK